VEFDNVPLISADSHVEEPPGLWSGALPGSAVPALPPELQPQSESEGAFARRIGVGETRELTEAEREGERHRQEVAARGTTRVEGRYAAMREDGIAAECIYPTRGLYVWNMEDPELGRLCCRIYNDWIHDCLESRSARFRCAALVPTWRVADAIAEVQRAVGLGLGALMLPLVGAPPYNHRDWEPLWSAIEETGCPVVMHQGTGHDMLFYRGPGAAVANLLATQSLAPRTAGLLAMSGVLARHPSLHFVFVETNAGWISWAMHTLDHYHHAFQRQLGWVQPVLPEPPSFYIKRQLHGTFQVDPVAIRNVPETGTAPLLWGSDYPHHEGTFPHSRKTVSELCAQLDPPQAHDIVCGNAARLFRFDAGALRAPL
jgi:predicted TIM-barrel fold metal-dependent hydrolase